MTLLKKSLKSLFAPRHLIIVDGSIMQAIPEHPKRDFIFCLSTAFGDAYLFQVSYTVANLPKKREKCWEVSSFLFYDLSSISALHRRVIKLEVFNLKSEVLLTHMFCWSVKLLKLWVFSFE